MGEKVLGKMTIEELREWWATQLGKSGIYPPPPALYDRSFYYLFNLLRRQDPKEDPPRANILTLMFLTNEGEFKKFLERIEDLNFTPIMRIYKEINVIKNKLEQLTDFQIKQLIELSEYLLPVLQGSVTFKKRIYFFISTPNKEGVPTSRPILPRKLDHSLAATLFSYLTQIVNEIKILRFIDFDFNDVFIKKILYLITSKARKLASKDGLDIDPEIAAYCHEILFTIWKSLDSLADSLGIPDIHEETSLLVASGTALEKLTKQWKHGNKLESLIKQWEQENKASSNKNKKSEIKIYSDTNYRYYLPYLSLLLIPFFGFPTGYSENIKESFTYHREVLFSHLTSPYHVHYNVDIKQEYTVPNEFCYHDSDYYVLLFYNLLANYLENRINDLDENGDFVGNFWIRKKLEVIEKLVNLVKKLTYEEIQIIFDKLDSLANDSGITIGRISYDRQWAPIYLLLVLVALTTYKFKGNFPLKKIPLIADDKNKEEITNLITLINEYSVISKQEWNRMELKDEKIKEEINRKIAEFRKDRNKDLLKPEDELHKQILSYLKLISDSLNSINNWEELIKFEKLRRRELTEWNVQGSILLENYIRVTRGDLRKYYSKLLQNYNDYEDHSNFNDFERSLLDYFKGIVYVRELEFHLDHLTPEEYFNYMDRYFSSNFVRMLRSTPHLSLDYQGDLYELACSYVFISNIPFKEAVSLIPHLQSIIKEIPS